MRTMTTTAGSAVHDGTTTPPPVDPDRPRSRVSQWSVRHRWLVLALSVLALVAGIGLMATQGIATTPPEDQLVGDSALAAQVEERAGVGATPTETVIVTARDGILSPDQATQIGTQLAAAYAGVEGVASVGEPEPGADGRSVVLPLTLDAEEDPAEFS